VQVETLFAVLLLAATVPAAGGSLDVGLDSLLSPYHYAFPAGELMPRVLCTNGGPDTAVFAAFFTVHNPGGVLYYLDSLPVTVLAPGADTVLSFRDSFFNYFYGVWATQCSVYAPGDTNPANDVVRGTTTISPG
jgi:hypothetical protein